ILGFLIVLGMGAYFLYNYGWESPSEDKEILNLSSLMFPSLLFICLAGLNTALLQCERSYFLPAVAPVAFNLIWIVAVLGFQSYPSQQAMPKLALWIVVACFFQWAITIPKVFTILQKYGFNFKSLKSLNLISKDLKMLFKPFFLGMIGTCAAQI